MNKTYGEKYFYLNKKILVYCWTYETKYSWGHYADLFINGVYTGHKKITYYNRTWEAYTYQSILECIISDHKKLFTKRQYTYLRKWIERGEKKARQQADKDLKTIAMIAKMGEVFGNTQTEKNDWKKRMLQAGLENKGLEIPEDWDSLTEDEKEKRLNGAINTLSQA